MIQPENKSILKRPPSMLLCVTVTVFFALLFFTVLFNTCGMWFETNDDVCISEILSGKMTGTAEWHIPYVSVCLTYPISSLYTLLPGFPWWGAFLCSLLVVSVTVTLFSLLCNSQNRKQFLLILVVFGCAVLLGLHNFGQVQFTSAAMIMAAAGYIALCGLKNRTAVYVIFVICELLACLTRDSSMLIVQPMGFALFFGRTWFAEAEADIKEHIRKVFSPLLKCFITVILILLFSKITTKVMFLSDEWKTFEKTDEVCICLLDHEGEIPYADVRDILEKYHISEDDYDNFLKYRIDYCDYRFSPECIDELLPRVQQLRRGEQIGENINFLAGFWGLLFASNEFFQVHRVVFLLYVLLSLLLLINKRRQLLFELLLTFGGYALGLAVLTIRNRYVFRVMIPYYFAAILTIAFFFSAFIVGEEVNSGKGKVKKLLSIGLFVLFFALAGYKVGRSQFSYIKVQNNQVNSVNKGTIVELIDYCNENQEKAFILDNSIIKSISTQALETQYYERGNYICSGSWFGFAPSVLAVGKEYLQNKDCYYMVYEAQSWIGADGLDFYDKYNEGEHELFDKYKSVNGATIWVYHIYPNDVELIPAMIENNE